MTTGEEETLSGRIERVTFANPDNGWTVLAVRTASPRRSLTAVGHLPSPAVGEFIEMTGRFVDNPQFGRQFQVTRARFLPPKTEAGLKKYLGSGLIKGLGPVLAGRLVDYFGPDKVLEVLDNSPERLTEVPGLGAYRRETIIEGWRRNQGLKRLLGFLAEFGLGPAVGLKVMRRLGEEAEALIRDDPYRLAYEIDGVGFATADKVARSLGLTASDPRRLAAGLLFVLNQSADDGHVYTPQRDLLAAGAGLLPEAGPEALKEALAHLLMAGQVQGELGDEPGEADFYLPRLQRAENWVARDLLAILRTPATVEVPRQPQALAWAEKALGLALSESQRQAVALALSQKILVITGGPGTGKTTLTRAITAIFGALRARLGLVAPTGRAARRLAEATGLPAKTVHRLLEYAPQVGFQRHPERKLELDLLLVDEASMVDLPLMNQLTGALPHTARLILVGDRDQLPSVGPGRVLADLIDSRAVAVARLTEVHRQAEGSQIVRAAHQVRRGLVPESSSDQDRGDFYFLEESDPGRILSRLLNLVTRTLPIRRELNPLEDIQVLTPMHGRDLGTEHLNQVLSERLNPVTGPALTRFGRRFRLGDRVMQLRNNYNREVFNGDGGRVERIDPETQELTVNFEGRPVVYDFAELDELTLAYAITIHKAQGSEFPAVIIPLTSSHHIMLRRNLLYTALARGRRLVVLIGSSRALASAVANDREQVRRSHLSQKLQII